MHWREPRTPRDPIDTIIIGLFVGLVVCVGIYMLTRCGSALS